MCGESPSQRCFGSTQPYRLIRGLYVFKSPLGHNNLQHRPLSQRYLGCNSSLEVDSRFPVVLEASPDEPYGVPPDTSARSAPSAWELASSHHSHRHESETRDAIADHDNSDHEHNQDHDRHIVLHQPLP
jgi:hypothetical protein